MSIPDSEASRKKLRPFLRWAGGKQGLIKHLLKSIPPDFDENGNTYYEPFLGAGSLFLTLLPGKAVLSDLNEHLIHCFKTIRDNPETFYRYCKEHVNKTSKEYYYEIRDEFNRNINRFDIKQAARFLYLNRSSFNGIFRVNQGGQYNVPYGMGKIVTIPSREEINQLSCNLKYVDMISASYEQILPRVRKDDFVYIDPPYPPINGTSYFTHYTKERFNIDDQKNVAIFANRLDRIGCRVLISNADLQEIRELYKRWNMMKIEVTRFITCKSIRYKIGELIITNY